MQLKIKVTARASRNAITGWQGEALKIAVTAAPEQGKANKAVLALLAKTLGLRQQAICISRGHTSAHKTVTVSVERRFTHPVLKKTIRKSKKYRAHDPENTFKKGDTVRIQECAPVSKNKRWEVVIEA